MITLVDVHFTCSFRIISTQNLRKMTTTQEEKKPPEEHSQQQTGEQGSKLKEEIDKLNLEITQLKEKNNELLVSKL